MASMDAVRRKIAAQQRQKAAGVKGYWQMKATIREALYPIILDEGDRTDTDNPSEVVNRALRLMQRLMDATGGATFREAVESVIYSDRRYSSSYNRVSRNHEEPYPAPIPRAASTPLQPNKSESESQFDQLMNG